MKKKKAKSKPRKGAPKKVGAALPVAISLDQVIDVVVQVESGGDPDVKGDLGLAWGILQTHQGALDDANVWLGKKWKLADLMGAPDGVERSREVFKAYMARYATQKRLGRPVTPTDMARIWNGGPNGWAKSSTRGYAEKFRRAAVARFGAGVLI